ncbi:MAG: RdgB/HAM1 family non-canonical purine NTP pyrophosphatase [Verrucomicrobiia bacterium]
MATTNPGKAREFADLLGGDWEVLTLRDVPERPEVEECGATFLENAMLKALAFADFEGWVVADDSGLEVDALEGAPGVRSARFAGEPKDDGRNNAKLLAAMEGVPPERRGAQFRCVLVLARGGVVRATAEGVVRGMVLEQPRGAGGFGYDPLFQPVGEARSMAELPREVKNRLSHRGQAVRALVAAWPRGE